MIISKLITQRELGFLQGFAAFFYTGNIYGSVAAAQIFNARIDFEFQNGLKIFLEQENYFLPEYDFCK